MLHRQRYLTLLLLVLLLAGCAFQVRIAEDGVAYNKTVERMQNELLFLNILRAKDRKPMHFTALSLIRGNLRGSFDSRGTFPFGGDASDNFTANAGASYTSNPSFDVAILNSQEFMRGIMKPTPMETILYYQDQGWPPRLLAYLFIRRIDVKLSEKEASEKEVSMKVHLNYPPDRGKFADFVTLIEAHNISIVTRELPPTVIGPVPALDLGNLVKAHEAGLKVIEKEGKNGMYILQKPRIAVEFLLIEKKDKTTIRLKPPSPVPLGSPSADTGSGDSSSAVEQHQTKQTTDSPEKTPEKKPKKIGIVYVRSPEAILYYLGELVRAQEADDQFKTPKIKTRIGPGCDDKDNPKWNLFLARRQTTADGDPLVFTEYNGTTYVIPAQRSGDDGSGRSMNCLNLVTQLIALQKVSKELPTTSAVTLTGQ